MIKQQFALEIWGNVRKCDTGPFVYMELKSTLRGIQNLHLVKPLLSYVLELPVYAIRYKEEVV